MTWAPRSVTLALLSMALAGCTTSTDGVPGTRDVISGTYQCDDGKSFAFTTTRGSETITLDLGGATYELQQEPGLSGTSRYSDGTRRIWTTSDGRFANIEGTAEPFSNCEAVAWERGGVIE